MADPPVPYAASQRVILPRNAKHKALERLQASGSRQTEDVTSTNSPKATGQNAVVNRGMMHSTIPLMRQGREVKGKGMKKQKDEKVAAGAGALLDNKAGGQKEDMQDSDMEDAPVTRDTAAYIDAVSFGGSNALADAATTPSTAPGRADGDASFQGIPPELRLRIYSETGIFTRPIVIVLPMLGSSILKECFMPHWEDSKNLPMEGQETGEVTEALASITALSKINKTIANEVLQHFHFNAHFALKYRGCPMPCPQCKGAAKGSRTECCNIFEPLLPPAIAGDMASTIRNLSISLTLGNMRFDVPAKPEFKDLSWTIDISFKFVENNNHEGGKVEAEIDTSTAEAFKPGGIAVPKPEDSVVRPEFDGAAKYLGNCLRKAIAGDRWDHNGILTFLTILTYLRIRAPWCRWDGKSLQHANSTEGLQELFDSAVVESRMGNGAR